MLRRHARHGRRVEPAGIRGAGARSATLRLAIPLALALLALLIRVPGLGRPLLGSFSTKAAVYGMIARSFARGEAHLLYPQIDVLVGGRPSYHLLECPLSAYLTGALWRWAGGDLGVWGRATSVVWSVVSVLLLYRLVLEWHGRVAAAGAALALALSPASIIYGQSFQLEASLVALSLLTLLSLERALSTSGAGWNVVLLFSAAALWLTKIYMLYLVPVLLAVVWSHHRTQARAGAAPRRNAALSLGALAIAIVPPGLWYAHMVHAGQPTNETTAGHVYFSLQATRQAHPFPHPLLKSADFYKGILDDLTGVVLTPVGFALVLLGAMGRVARRYVVWLAAAAGLVIVAPRKFHEMNYYWLAVLPLFCMLAGLGVDTLWRGTTQAGGSEPERGTGRMDRHGAEGAARRSAPSPLGVRRFGLASACVVWLVLSLRYSVIPAFHTPAEDRAVVAAAQAVRRNTGPEARVVTIHGTNIDLLYYCDRKGWTLEVPSETAHDPAGSAAPFAALNDLIRQGATHLVVANLEGLRRAARFRQQLRVFALLQRGEDYAVYRLEPDEHVGGRVSRSAAGTTATSRR